MTHEFRSGAVDPDERDQKQPLRCGKCGKVVREKVSARVAKSSRAWCGDCWRAEHGDAMTEKLSEQEEGR